MNLPLLCLFLLSLSFLSYRHSKPWRFNKDMYFCYHNSSTRWSICGRCSTRRTSPAGRKHCRSFEVLRDHLGTSGSTLPKAANCTDAFAMRGYTTFLCPHQSLHARSQPINVLALAHPADVEGAAASLAARDAATRRRRRARAGYKMVDTESDSYTRRREYDLAKTSPRPP
jgi:hypothetical protein